MQTSGLPAITLRRRKSREDPSSGALAGEYCGEYTELVRVKYHDVQRVISLARIGNGGSACIG
jgi:hypothetical protein